MVCLESIVFASHVDLENVIYLYSIKVSGLHAQVSHLCNKLWL